MTDAQQPLDGAASASEKCPVNPFVTGFDPCDGDFQQNRTSTLR